MPFEKGNKLGKNRKGIPNKTNKVCQEAIATALDGSADKIKSALDKLEGDPVAYINAIAKILPFVVPKKTDITSDGDKVSMPDLSGLTFEELYELKFGKKPI